MLFPQAKADDYNPKTVLTFNSPVEVPGQVLLAGTYVFKLIDSQPDQSIVQVYNILQVYNQDEDHLYGTFLVVPNYRLKPTGNPIITFEEQAAGTPQIIKAWFYPSGDYGYQFVYPKVKTVDSFERAEELLEPAQAKRNVSAGRVKSRV
jgi:hypothetical protein